VRTQNPGSAAPSASPLSSKVESASQVGRFPDFRVVACARLPPAALGRSDIKCASAHRIQWRDRGLGPAHSCARLPLPSNPLARAPTGIPLFRCYCVYPSTTADHSQDSDEPGARNPCATRGHSRATRGRLDPGGRSRQMGCAYTAYAAGLPSTAHLAGLLICVHIVNGFSRMCRESGLWLMHIGTYVRIKAGGGSIWWSRRWMMG
jgi:hypothetical protein